MARVPANTNLATKTGIQNSTYTYAADAEASDAYAITLTPAPSAYATGQLFHFLANTANTGAASLNVNGLGAKTIKKSHDQDLASNDIEAGQVVTVVYDGTNFQMQSQTAATAATGDVAGPSSATDNAITRFDGTTGKIIQDYSSNAPTVTDAGVFNIPGLTASELIAMDGSNNLVSLAVATYPSLAELAYVKGVTSAIQTQLNAKAPSTSPTFATSITGSYLTASEILITDGSKNIVSAAVATYPSLAELAYVKGVTSAIQTQLDAKLALAGGTMTGSITLGENTSIALDPAGSADGKYTGITVTGTGGATIAFGDLVYLKASDSEWYLTDADAVGTAGTVMIGMAVTSSTDGNPITVLLQGIIRADAKFPALTISAPVYAGVTAGAIQVAAPSGTDDVVRVVGFALTADEIYFNPSPDHITVV